MKNLKRVVVAVIAIVFSTAAIGQADATATAAANIINPISITKVKDMNFGNIAVHQSTGGDVILSTASGRTSTGGVTMPAVSGTVQAAEFTVSGEGGRTYTVTLPSSVTLNNGAASMTADTFTSNPGTTAGAGLLSGTAGSVGTQTLLVGATLHVSAGQAVGPYLSSTPFTVTVNYN